MGGCETFKRWTLNKVIKSLEPLLLKGIIIIFLRPQVAPTKEGATKSERGPRLVLASILVSDLTIKTLL